MSEIKSRKVFSKEVYNIGVKPVIIKKTVRENIVIQVQRKMRFEIAIADNLLKNNKGLVDEKGYKEYLKNKEEPKVKKEEK